MPQLNPAPWFFIFMFTWTLFIIIMNPKITNLMPTLQASYHHQTTSTTNWNWPWL
uniref:ATP synthase complex subunit 8 n=1 Tax=Psammodromus algirus TaxID=80460 RepID=A0A8A3WQH3_PSAAL|nr:ATP synthase F0 subunit 8 [Psammodromus algirus]QTA72607.1 ATP synthase F0 subunit 8 [Psammodromus algirus]